MKAVRLLPVVLSDMHDFAAAAGETATNSVGVDASVQTHVARHQAQAVVAAQNFGRRKQTLDMLQR
jgi:hypothetical protein